LPRFRQRFDFICPVYGDICSLLDAAKVADCLLLTMSASTCDIDNYAEHCLSCLLSQGLPASVVCVQVTSVTCHRLQNYFGVLYTFIYSFMLKGYSTIVVIYSWLE